MAALSCGCATRTAKTFFFRSLDTSGVPPQTPQNNSYAGHLKEAGYNAIHLNQVRSCCCALVCD